MSVERRLRDAMTVGQLIEELQTMNQDAKVVFACDYGDYHHTTQALIIETVDEISGDEYLTTSAYSQSGLAIEELDESDFDENGECDKDQSYEVVVLRG